MLVNILFPLSKYLGGGLELIKGFGVWLWQGACYKNRYAGSGEFLQVLCFRSSILAYLKVLPILKWLGKENATVEC
jgi:hypothetical protein